MCANGERRLLRLQLFCTGDEHTQSLIHANYAHLVKLTGDTFDVTLSEGNGAVIRGIIGSGQTMEIDGGSIKGVCSSPFHSVFYFQRKRIV